MGGPAAALLREPSPGVIDEAPAHLAGHQTEESLASLDGPGTRP